MVSPPISPPAAKRLRLDPDQTFSTLPPSPSTSSSPFKGNGHVNGNSIHAPPPATPAPQSPGAMRSAIDVCDDDEPEQTVVQEEEDLSRRDMYLDTVCLLSITPNHH